MNKPVNLNSLLEGVLRNNDEDAAQQLIDFSLNAPSILTAIRKTKNYSALKTFSSLIDFKDDKTKEELSLIYVDTIANGNLRELEEYISDRNRASCAQIALACGKSGVDYDLVPRECQKLATYCSGLAESDNLEMLLRFEDRLNTLVNVYESAGRGCATKVMNYYGFSPNMMENYICGAFYGLNKETLIFLREYPKLIEYFFLNHINCNFLSKQHSFCLSCIRKGIITLSDEGWRTLKVDNGILYDALQNDV